MTERKIKTLVGQGLLTMALVVGAMSGRAEAGSIGLTPVAGSPDIMASFFKATYDPLTGDLLIGSSAPSLVYTYLPEYDARAVKGTMKEYSFDANVNNLTGALGLGSPQSVMIKGKLDGIQQTLLAGTIIGFGWNGDTVRESTILEFLVDVNGGLPAFGSRAGIIMSQLNFVADPSNPGKFTSGGVADNFAVPDHTATLGLLSIALSSIVAARRRMTTKQ